jgi:phosphatidylinositol alpha-1,6-mannosyltransferase
MDCLPAGQPGSGNAFLPFVRVVCLALDILVFRISLAVYRLSGMTVVCDRYLYDTLVHCVFLGAVTAPVANIFLRLTPKPDIAFLLSVDDNTAMAREKAHEDIGYYSAKRKIYDAYAAAFKAVPVDTCRPEEDVWNSVKDEIDLMTKRSVLMVSRAVEPPWDEASKNLVRDIANSIDGYRFHILTAHLAAAGSKRGMIPEKIYSSPRQTLLQKLRLCLFLLTKSNKYAIRHYCFTPEPLTSFIIRLASKGGGQIQNVPYLSERAAGAGLGSVIYAKDVVVNSDNTYRFLKDRLTANIHRIYPSVDTDIFRPADDRQAAKKKNGVTGVFNVMWAGKLVSERAASSMEDIISGTCARCGDINFILAVRRDNLAEKIRAASLGRRLCAAGFGGRVRFVFRTEDMASLMSACDMLIYPFFRGFKKKIDIPYVILEAMSCGLPVIISDIEPINEAIKEGAGISVKGEDPVSFSGAIMELLRDAERRRTLSERNRAAVLKYFNLKNNIREYEKIYESVMNGR